MRKNVFISLSGGLDSAVAMAHTIFFGADPGLIQPVFFDYNQKPGIYETAAATQIAQHYKTQPLKVIHIDSIIGKSKKCALLKESLKWAPRLEYSTESMKSTVVPGRNMLFIAILSSMAMDAEGGVVMLGVHSGDHDLYPDCRPEFIQHVEMAVFHGTEKRVSLLTPLLYLTKTGIVSMGRELNVPFHLTRSCYTENQDSCGLCGTCRERLAAFKANGIDDPITYEQNND